MMTPRQKWLSTRIDRLLFEVGIHRDDAMTSVKRRMKGDLVAASGVQAIRQAEMLTRAREVVGVVRARRTWL